MTYEWVLLHLRLREDCRAILATSTSTKLFRHRFKDLLDLTLTILRKVHAVAARIETTGTNGSVEDVHE